MVTMVLWIIINKGVKGFPLAFYNFYFSAQMFVTVKYGDGEELLCNLECKTNVLLDDIRRRCSYGKEVMVDLSDENGNLKYLRGHPESYATEFLKNRESLVLVRVNKNPINDTITYSPLLEDIFIVTTSFIERLTSCGDLGTKQNHTKNSSLANNVKKHQAVSKAKNSFLASASKSRGPPNRRLSRSHSKERKSR
ncbi:uncharacterized protein CXorf65 homolog [Xenia sp. Carnegie-2017]|uniref:uncharacterized protein CXorf65 homolog n=1 Tax=Xenia sp. Carnegie-2017 TaxID=2897299 RepID=UPI001F04B68E|nr:uncharacterized protein CXorf65 homolog [Xenia sp. Carnegie-2017]XP_046852056.1 uncharacterized protein CXorf65 homolog [Xenia sp. Carnegie-2017]XP_046852058.1 uncharacterized protein CXorf65 homolog [Xenia sp. Carnegie-2017]XP_046852059.1 uncharacterized protein CXorf65 homolog [Xenia sp. Carnegie-2017]